MTDHKRMDLVQTEIEIDNPNYVFINHSWCVPRWQFRPLERLQGKPLEEIDLRKVKDYISDCCYNGFNATNRGYWGNLSTALFGLVGCLFLTDYKEDGY